MLDIQNFSTVDNETTDINVNTYLLGIAQKLQKISFGN